MLKLIVSHPDPEIEAQSAPKEMPIVISQEPFSTKIYSKGPSLYLLMAQDPSHRLESELLLEVIQNAPDVDQTVVICHYPVFSTDHLNTFIEGDSTLFSIITIQYQMKIMEQILLFSRKHAASNLILYSDEPSSEIFGLFRDFFSTLEDNDPHEIVIPIDHTIQNKWSDYMSQVSLKFGQTLWQGQRWNRAIKNYLATHPFGKGVSS